jgi:tetratricopeptide (TPR) repeat protein
MKKLTILFALLMYGGAIYSQKVKVQSAWNYYKYDQLDKAKVAIDEAAEDNQTKVMDKTWYYRGLIYHAMFKHEKYNNLDPQPLQKAYDYYSKAIELNPKSEFADSIKIKKFIIVNQLFGKGVDQFAAKDFNGALETFESVLKMTPGDTLATLNAAYSAERSANNEKAKQYYTQLIDMNYGEAKIYTFLSKIYKAEKDTAKAFEVVKLGRQRFPADNNLIIEELNFYLYSGKSKEAMEPLNLAISKDPTNASLYFARGSIYDKLDDSEKAKADYMKAIELKPDYFDAYYNLGAMYFNQGADLSNKANSIAPEKVKEFNEAKAKADAKFKEAQPYLEKAHELNATDMSTLVSLKQLYARTGDTAKAGEMKKLIDAQKQ